MLSDGEYSIEVSLQGGSGKAGVTSPAKLSVTDGQMQAEIEWSSSHYDYMEVDGKEYYPVNTEGNSLFLIDVSELDSDIPVKAETLAMSEPHMINYTLNFDSSTAKAQNSGGSGFITITVCVCAVVVIAAATAIFIGKKKAHDKK